MWGPNWFWPGSGLVFRFPSGFHCSGQSVFIVLLSNVYTVLYKLSNASLCDLPLAFLVWFGFPRSLV